MMARVRFWEGAGGEEQEAIIVQVLCGSDARSSTPLSRV